MSRKKTLKVSGINIRVHTRHEPDEYVALWKALFRLKRAKRRGATATMIGMQRHLTEGVADSSVFGYFYRFIEIDPDSPWFNIDTNRRAEPEDVAQVAIPRELKPNLTEVPYLFDVRRHKLYFASGGSGDSVSPGIVMSLLEELRSFPRIIERFGHIDLTVMSQTGLVDELLGWPEIRSMHIELERPNPTEFDDERRYFERLQRRNVSKETYGFTKTPGTPSIVPDAEMSAMIRLAVNNGEYKQRGISPAGVLEEASSKDYPLKEVGEYDPEQQLESDAFIQFISDRFGRQR